MLIILLSTGAGLVNATAQAPTNAYVTNLSGTVSVIDTTTNTVVATVPVGIFPSGVAITPDGTRVYVTNIFNSISVIDAATNTVVVTIPSGQFPTGIAITPDGTRADRILLFARISPIAAVPSNCAGVLLRMREKATTKNYSVTYREGQRVIASELPETFDARARAYLLLKRHGQQLCKRANPKCPECVLLPQCAYAALNSRA